MDVQLKINLDELYEKIIILLIVVMVVIVGFLCGW